MSKLTKELTSTVIVLSQDTPVKVLLLHHVKANLWMPPGGHQERWENALETAARETLEETDLDITTYLPQVEYLDANHAIIPTPRLTAEVRIPARHGDPEHYHIDQLYVVRVPTKAVSINSSESHNFGWFTLEDTKKLSIPIDMVVLIEQELTS